MKLSSDSKYTLSPDCANDSETGATVAAWNPQTKQPHPNYPESGAFIQQYGAEIPDPEPTPEPESEPNWVQFRAQIVTQPAYFRLVAGHPQNSVLNTLLVPLLFGVGDNPNLLGEVAQLWNVMVGNMPPTAIEISQLNAVAEACAVPLRLDAMGRMEVE